MTHDADHLLFDLDGTLADGRRGIVQSLQYALRKFGLSRDEERLLHFIGPPLHEIFSEGFGFDEAKTLDAVDTYREYYGDTGIYEVDAYPGIAALVRALADEGRTLAVATSKPHVYATRILEHLDLADSFRFVSGPELDGTRRHKPEIIEHALAQLGHPARDDAVMIGDRIYDVRGARKTGLRSISVGWGFGSSSELADASADHHVGSVAELAALLSPPEA